MRAPGIVNSMSSKYLVNIMKKGKTDMNDESKKQHSLPTT